MHQGLREWYHLVELIINTGKLIIKHQFKILKKQNVAILFYKLLTVKVFKFWALFSYFILQMLS